MVRFPELIDRARISRWGPLPTNHCDEQRERDRVRWIDRESDESTLQWVSFNRWKRTPAAPAAPNLKPSNRRIGLILTPLHWRSKVHLLRIRAYFQNLPQFVGEIQNGKIGNSWKFGNVVVMSGMMQLLKHLEKHQIFLEMYWKQYLWSSTN